MYEPFKLPTQLYSETLDNFANITEFSTITLKYL